MSSPINMIALTDKRLAAASSADTAKPDKLQIKINEFSCSFQWTFPGEIGNLIGDYLCTDKEASLEDNNFPDKHSLRCWDHLAIAYQGGLNERCPDSKKLHERFRKIDAQYKSYFQKRIFCKGPALCGSVQNPQTVFQAFFLMRHMKFYSVVLLGKFLPNITVSDLSTLIGIVDSKPERMLETAMECESEIMAHLKSYQKVLLHNNSTGQKLKRLVAKVVIALKFNR